jgi:hypothetical protein
MIEATGRWEHFIVNGEAWAKGFDPFRERLSNGESLPIEEERKVLKSIGIPLPFKADYTVYLVPGYYKWVVCVKVQDAPRSLWARMKGWFR